MIRTDIITSLKSCKIWLKFLAIKKGLKPKLAMNKVRIYDGDLESLGKSIALCLKKCNLINLDSVFILLHF